jgi:hypothetical protein
MSKETNLKEYVKLLQAAARNSLLRRENNNKLIEKVISKT